MPGERPVRSRQAAGTLAGKCRPAAAPGAITPRAATFSAQGHRLPQSNSILNTSSEHAKEAGSHLGDAPRKGHQGEREDACPELRGLERSL